MGLVSDKDEYIVSEGVKYVSIFYCKDEYTFLVDVKNVGLLSDKE